MRFSILTASAVALALAAAAAPSPAQQDAPPDAATPSPPALTIATKVAPPYAMKRPDGSWHGISIALWEAVADELGLDYTYREVPIQDMIDAIAQRTADAGVAAITITPEREERIDFAHPFQVAGLGVAVPDQGWLGHTFGLVKGLFSATFWTATIGLLVLLLAIGALMWAVERRKNAEQFGGPARSGLASGLWWSAVTMTTVGYGDKVPITLAGRIIGLVWMFAGIIIISAFTAAFASALTLGGLQNDIAGVDDLAGRRVGVVEGATSEAALLARGVSVQAYPSIEAAMDALQQDRLDALVHDRPILRYLIAHAEEQGVHLLPLEFERQDYGIALPEQSPLREPINRALLDHIASETWRENQTRYLGEGS